MRAPFLAVAVLLGQACGDNCPRRLLTRATYTGAQSGDLYARERAPGGFVRAFTSAPIRADAGAPSGQATGSACFSEGAPSDVPGWQLEAWVDLDGDDREACRLAAADGQACGPEANEPQGTVAFTLKASGPTAVLLEIGDP